MSALLRPAPGELRGLRIVVRGYTDADAPALYEAIDRSRGHLRRWMPWVHFYESQENALSYVRECQAKTILREDFPMGMFTHEGGFLGGTGFHPRDWTVPDFEIGYWIRPDAEGHGYVSESVRLLTHAAFETMGAQRVLIRMIAANDRSRAVAERAGYTYEGRLRNLIRDPEGNLTDMLYYSMIPEEYERIREAP